MSFIVKSFPSANNLEKYVNDNTIPQANIQFVIHKTGQWYLFYWA